MKYLYFYIICTQLIVSAIASARFEPFSNLDAELLEKFRQLGLHNYIEQLLPAELPSNETIYDFIIVGGGPAGCVLANRLSENPKWSVYLLEAGGTENFFHSIPLLTSMLQSTHSNWNYKSTPQKNACFGMYNNQCALPRGRVLGGSSSINFMIYNRNNRRDFDQWTDAGNFGWSYEEVLPYFLRSEMANLEGLETSPYHNHSGLLSVEDVQYRSEMGHAFVKGAQQAGYKYTDLNGESQLGVSYVQATTYRGWRHSASKAYIDPIRNRRKNLSILTLARVTKVLIDPKTKSAYGVEFIHGEKLYTVRAKKEVILSAGTFHSPQLLILSGIGPTKDLQDLGIPQIHNLPVGKILYDHIGHFGPTFITNATKSNFFLNRITPFDVQQFILMNPKTKLSGIGSEALAFTKVPSSQEPSDIPDIEFVMLPLSLASDGGIGLKQAGNFRDDIYNTVYKPLENKQHFTLLLLLFHPKSSGHLWLKDNNPLNPPIINPKYFEVKDDIEYLVEGIKEAIRITETPAMKKIGTTLYTKNVLGCEDLQFGSDDYWRCSIKVMTYTLHNQVATCKMGPVLDSTAVVSPQLKVYGIRKLRVADTSVIPFPPTSHTNAISFMIGEKAADMIKSEWACSPN